MLSWHFSFHHGRLVLPSGEKYMLTKRNPSYLLLSTVIFMISIIIAQICTHFIICKDIQLECAARSRSSMNIDWLFQCSWHCSPWEAKGNEEDPEPDLEPAAARLCTAPCICQVTLGIARRWLHEPMLPPFTHPHTSCVTMWDISIFSVNCSR